MVAKQSRKQRSRAAASSARSSAGPTPRSKGVEDVQLPLPVGADRVPVEVLRQAVAAVAQNRASLAAIDAAHRTMVEHLRLQYRASWSVIGWVLGTTGEAARKRYGVRR